MMNDTPNYTTAASADEKRAQLLEKVATLTEDQAAMACELLKIYTSGTEAEREELERLTAGLDTLTDAEASANRDALEALISAHRAQKGGGKE